MVMELELYHTDQMLTMLFVAKQLYDLARRQSWYGILQGNVIHVTFRFHCTCCKAFITDILGLVLHCY